MSELNDLPISRARLFLLDMLDKRELRKWCIVHGLSAQHVTAYRLAIGAQPISWKSIKKFGEFIPPIDWLYNSQEELPYERKTLEDDAEFDSGQSLFFEKFGNDAKAVAAKCRIDPLDAYMMATSRKMPNIEFMRGCCNFTDPIDFFLPATEIAPEDYGVPERGEIIEAAKGGGEFLVLTSSEETERSGRFMACAVVKDSDSGFPLTGFSGRFADIFSIRVRFFNKKTKRLSIGRTDEATVAKISDAIKKMI